MITVRYREPSDFLSDAPNPLTQFFVTNDDAAYPSLEDGWLQIRDYHGRVIFMVSEHKVLDYRGEYVNATEG